MTTGDVRVRNLNIVLFVKNVVLRRGLDAVLHQLPMTDSIHHCGDPLAVREFVDAGKADVLILTATEHVAASDLHFGPNRPKILLVLDEAQAADPMVTAGMPVDGFLVQQELTAAHLRAALDRVLVGEMPMPSALGRSLLARAGSSRMGEKLRPVTLTQRESETVALLSEGLSNKQIARRLSISEHGAKRLVTSVMLKLGAPNRTAAVVAAIKSGIISAD